jgi:hypothetical protein
MDHYRQGHPPSPSNDFSGEQASILPAAYGKMLFQFGAAQAFHPSDGIRASHLVLLNIQQTRS